jgi:hypothetical protein
MSMSNRVGWGGILLISVSLTGCPGYLEEQAWFPDGGRVTYGPPPSADGPIAQRPPIAPVAGSSGTPAPVAGTGGGSGSGAGGSGGGGGSVSAAPVKMDGAVRAAAGRPTDGGGAPDGPPAVPLCATAAEITSKILMPRCAGCHKANMPAAGLDLATAGAKMRLVGRMSRCMNKPLVTADPVGGHLFDKLGGAVTGCGQRMPLMGTPLTPTEIQCMKDWINFIPPPPVQAPPNGVPLCATAPEISSKILVPKCGTCHGAAMPAAGLDLVTAGAKARLLNIPSRACNSKPLIVAEPAVGGHFFDKLAGAVPGCGNQMPFGGINPLSAAEVQCLKDWIKPPAPPVQ